jgi:alkylation response protein AidB-like acyl-CoA dehydrogenase
MGQYTSLGRSTFTAVHPTLRDEARVCEQGVAHFSQAVEGVLKRYGKGIIGQQIVSRRLADVAIDLFVGMCLLSRVSSMIAEKGDAATVDERRIARIFTYEAKNRVAANLKSLHRNADEDVVALAQSMFARGAFPWDVL